MAEYRKGFREEKHIEEGSEKKGRKKRKL